MKLVILRFVVVTLACACALIAITNQRAQNVSANQNKFAPLYSALGMPQPEQTPAATQEKTIAQEGREKNVKLLGDLPVSQFIPVMNYFAASLGRRCNFCHVNNNGQWDYASDAKTEKNTAREMIKMVLVLHKQKFPGERNQLLHMSSRPEQSGESAGTAVANASPATVARTDIRRRTGRNQHADDATTRSAGTAAIAICR